jgi:hypothetical protein
VAYEGEIPMTDLERRLMALQRRLNTAAGLISRYCGGPLHVVIITGCVPSPSGEPLYGNAGGSEWIRGETESLDDFANRAAAGAHAAGHALLLLGGQPKTQAQQDVADAASRRMAGERPH